MKKLTCEMCGSTELIKEDDVFVCQHCGTKYSVEAAKKMMVEGTVDVSGSTVKIDQSSRIDNLYQLARRAKDDENTSDGAEYYGQIAIERPNDWEAQFYRVVFKSCQTNIAGIGNAAIQVANSLPSVFGLVEEHVPQEEKKEVYVEINRGIDHFNGLLLSNVSDFAVDYDNNEDRTNFLLEHIPSIASLAAALGDCFDAVGETELAVENYKNAVSIYDAANLTNSIFIPEVVAKIKKIDPSYQEPETGGCYIATCVYGSYDCPEVWTLRRFRDENLLTSIPGRCFVRTYYAVSPTLVILFGETRWFNTIWKNTLDKMISKLRDAGYEDTPYCDK